MAVKGICYAAWHFATNWKSASLSIFFFTFVNTKWILVSHEIIILAIKGKASLIYKWRFDIKVWLVWLAFVGVRKKTKIFLKFWSELSQVARMCEFSSYFVRRPEKNTNASPSLEEYYEARLNFYVLLWQDPTELLPCLQKSQYQVGNRGILAGISTGLAMR